MSTTTVTYAQQMSYFQVCLDLINSEARYSVKYNQSFYHCLLKFIILKHTYSPFTVRIWLLELFPHGLLAWHMYSPDWFLLTLVSASGFSKKRVPVLTSNQETDGIGIPVTEQFKVAFFPSTAVPFSTCFMADPSKSEQKQSGTSKLRVLHVNVVLIRWWDHH